jgi:hypothetical protein
LITKNYRKILYQKQFPNQVINQQIGIGFTFAAPCVNIFVKNTRFFKLVRQNNLEAIIHPKPTGPFKFYFLIHLVFKETSNISKSERVLT